MLRKRMIFTLILWSCVLFIQFQSVFPVQPFFKDDVLTVEAHTIRSSEVKSMLVDRNVSKIFVYLTDTFYVDDDLKLNGIRELQIFASTWNIIQPATFDLSGLNGSNGESQESLRVKGSAGSNGYPGIDGGNFFGLANKTINGDYLTVISNGGNGGDGEDGAASDDVYVLLNAAEDSGDTGWFSSGDLRSYYHKYFDDRGYVSEISDIDDSTSLYAVFVHDKEASFNIRLHSPKCCGTTGIGGAAGGHGGRSGQLIFKHFGESYESKSRPKLFANNGSVGKSGKTAKTCENVALDVRVDVELRKIVFVMIPLHHSFSSKFTIFNHTKSSKCSPQYVSNNETVVPPESSKSDEIDTVSSVVEFKRFLIENMANASLTTIIQETYKAIDEDLEKENENSLIGLVLEACELEKNYFKLQKSPELIQLYRRLFDRVGNLKVKRQNEDDRSAVGHLKSILELKLRDMEDDYNLIVNLQLFAELTISRIDTREHRLSAITDVNDEKLQNSLNRLRLGVNGNFILGEYRHIIEGFQITHFPFAVDYLENYKISSSPMDYDNLSDLTIAATNNLKTLNRSIDEIESRNKAILINLNYIDVSNPRGALFIWKNSDIRDEIRKLFEGKKISLFADAKQLKEGYGPEYNAMKFKTIEIVFRSSNENANRQLNHLLEYLQSDLNHTGDAMTRCNNHFYRITTEPISIWASFDKTKEHIPYTRNGVYDLLRDNQPMLSPYALWEIQMEDIEDSRRLAQLSGFEMFDFNVELHGTGQYIAENRPICENKDLAKFYSQI